MAFERRSLELTREQWAALDQLAAQTASLAPSGPSAGQPSWRTLIKRIAEREVTCSTQAVPSLVVRSSS